MVIDKTDYSGKRKMDMTEMVIDAMASNHALIKQMGEALIGVVAVADRKTDEFDRAHAAIEAYNNWQRERGG